MTAFAVALLAVFPLSQIAANAAPIVPPHVPSGNASPSARQTVACSSLGQPYCDQAAVADINDVRALEGVRALVLPSNYSSLTAEEQVFVVTNLERVDRGLAPIAGLSHTLDLYALDGAKRRADPSGPAGYSWGSNEASGLINAPRGDFEWMYNDGFASGNLDCFAPSAPGCWGHRNNILWNWSGYPAPVAMGVGVYTPTSGFVGAFDNSLTQLWVAGWTGPLYFTWAHELPFLIGTVNPTAGYLMLGSTGLVYAFGKAHAGGSAVLASTDRAVHVEPAGNHLGYWVVNSRGNVFAFAGAGFYGGAPVLRASERVTTMSTTATGHGYWLFTSLGRALPYGDAHFYGDMRSTPLNGPVIASVATPTGHGYYMVGSDGGIFTFGDARFRGSLGHVRLNRPVVGISPTPNNLGYWLVAADGGVFAFNAPFRGSTGSIRLNRSVVGMVAFGNGYLMVASDGGVFDFSNRAFVGSLGSNAPLHPVVAIAPA